MNKDTNNIIQTIKINDILKGYNNFEKIRNVYNEIKKELYLKEPILKSEDPTITINNPNFRGNSYRWELYERNQTNILFEIYGEIGGYAETYKHNNLDLSSEGSIASHLKISLVPRDKDISHTIDRILKKYPAKEQNSKS